MFTTAAAAQFIFFFNGIEIYIGLLYFTATCIRLEVLHYNYNGNRRTQGADDIDKPFYLFIYFILFFVLFLEAN